MVAKFNVSEVLSMCYNSDFGLSEDKSTSEPIASGGGSASVGRLICQC